MNKLLTIGLAAVALMTAPSLAADLGVYAPAPAYSAPIEVAPPASAPVTDWSGAYVGVIGGYGWGESEHTTPGTAAFDIDGWVVGGEVGYNFHLDNDVVAGVLADITWTDLEGSAGTVSTDFDWLGTVRGRVGYAIDTFLPYVSGGFALADVNAVDTAIGGYDESEVQVGYTLGVGAELAVEDNISVKAEYLYVDLNGDKVIGDNPVVQPESNAHVLRAGVGFKF